MNCYYSQANYVFVYFSGVLQLQNKTGEAIWWPCQLKMWMPSRKGTTCHMQTHCSSSFDVL